MVDLPIDNKVMNKSTMGLPLALPGYFPETKLIKKVLFSNILESLAKTIDPPTGTIKFLSVL
jgi:hypothetical protein